MYVRIYIYIYLPEPKVILDYVGKTISGNYGAPSCRLGKVFGLILQVELMGTRAFQVRTLPCVIVFIDGVAKGHPTRVCFNIWIWYHQTYYALPCSTNCLSSYFRKEQINIKHIHTYSYVHTHNKIGSTHAVSSILFLTKPDLGSVACVPAVRTPGGLWGAWPETEEWVDTSKDQATRTIVTSKKMQKRYEKDSIFQKIFHFSVSFRGLLAECAEPSISKAEKSLPRWLPWYCHQGQSNGNLEPQSINTWLIMTSIRDDFGAQFGKPQLKWVSTMESANLDHDPLTRFMPGEVYSVWFLFVHQAYVFFVHGAAHHRQTSSFPY